MAMEGIDLNNPDRQALLEELARANELTRRENTLFNVYLARVQPGVSASAADEEEIRRTAASKPAAKPGGKKGAATKQAVKAERNLSPDEKYEVASAEIDVVMGQTEQLKTEGERRMDDLRAEMEEADLRIQEVKKDTYEFKRDIVIGAENARTGKTVAEKMLKHMEERLRQKDAMIEKLRLKNSALKIQVQKMETQLQQKEEMGEVLHVIDFDQLKIENQQYLEKIEERNNELLRLKLTTGKTVQVLNSLKKRLGALASQGEFLRKEAYEREDQLGRFDVDLNRVSDELAQADRTNLALRREREDTERPQVLDYIELRSEVQDLERKNLDWERKVEIASNALATKKRMARKTAKA